MASGIELSRRIAYNGTIYRTGALMKSHYYLNLNSHGLHRVHYTEWGTPNARPLICVHGLSRNGRDFDTLAHALSQKGYWVICPDMAGRGLSDWLLNPADYDLQQYLHDILALLARLQVEQVDWLGTSMGGLIGIALSSLANSPIKRLILNDIGPDISNDGIRNIKTYLTAKALSFTSLDQAEQYFRKSLQGFGAMTDEQWRHLTKCSIKPTPTGGYTLRCDPNIRIPDFTATDQQQLWHSWQQVRCPTLLIRGEHSDILSPQTVLKMQQHHRHLTFHEILEVGHAPSLATPEQIELVEQWLSKGHR